MAPWVNSLPAMPGERSHLLESLCDMPTYISVEVNLEDGGPKTCSLLSCCPSSREARPRKTLLNPRGERPVWGG